MDSPLVNATSASASPSSSLKWSSAFLDSMVPEQTTMGYPWYHVPSDDLLSTIPDRILSLILPVVAYWAYSLLFHFFDTVGEKWEWLEKYRIHEPTEVQSRNKVSKRSVVIMVVIQHAIQTALGLLVLEAPQGQKDHQKEMRALAAVVASLADVLLGRRTAARSLAAYGQQIIWWSYWWVVPTLQFFAGFILVDTWQYFFHRLFHTNQYLYKKFHSWHHRLYVPYAFGALYNHPFEGFLFDSLGTLVAHQLTFQSQRQAVFFFTFSTFKTVDDHCGYSLPFDPFQIFFSNNAAYHDIHHQSFGIKKNFSQPFFIHWDYWLGTRMTRAEADARIAGKKEKEL
jgi:sphinganine C4-monooxygenase